MVRKWRPIVAIVALLGVLSWIGSSIPFSPAEAVAADSLRLERLQPAAGSLRSSRADADGVGGDELEGDRERQRLLVDREFDDEEEYEEEWGEEDREEDEGELEEDEDWDEEDEEDWDEDEEYLEREMLYLEAKRGELQAIFGELEVINELTKILRDDDASACYAAIKLLEEVDDPEERIGVINDLMGSAQSTTVRRLLKLKLAEAYDDMDRGEDAYRAVRSVIVGE